MSRFSLNSSLTLFHSVASDSDATSSSTSSSSAINNSSNSLSVSPAIERDIRVNIQTKHPTSNHLLELQREIKEEEDEIFADINSLINNRSDLYSSLDDTDLEDNGVNLTCQIHNHYLREDHPSEEEEEDEEVEDEEAAIENERAKEDTEGQFTDEHNFVPCNRAGQQQDYQAIQKEIQQLTSNLPKPCVFFLEGNCRRSDCKYSHNLSSITCKYWIEGFCFKGDMCPFLHSYASNNTQDPNFLDEDGLSSLSKKEMSPTFVIESEADFPSLPLDAPAVMLNNNKLTNVNENALTKTMKNQILSSNPAVVFKTTKKKRRKNG